MANPSPAKPAKGQGKGENPLVKGYLVAYNVSQMLG